MKLFYLLVGVVVLLALSGCRSVPPEQEGEAGFPVLGGKYLGQQPPGSTPELFAEGVVSTRNNERDAAFSPDGSEFYYSLKGPSFFTIIRVRREGDRWLPPEVAPFSGRYQDLEPCFSPDGRRLYFVSNRPLEGRGEPKDFDIWFVERQGVTWGEPQNIGAPVNSEKNEFYPSFSDDGTLYLTAAYRNSLGGEDIFAARRQGDRFLPPENLGPAVNTEGGEFNSFVAPDGSFLIFTTTGRGSGSGGGDLWVSFRKDDGGWAEAQNMGESINSPALDYCPSLSPDGKYLFFTSLRSDYGAYSPVPLTYTEILKGLAGPRNGNGDIYWVNAAVIDSLKSDEPGVQ